MVALFCSLILIHKTNIILLFSHSVGSKSATPWHQASPSSSPEICSNSLPLSRWCHPTISASVVPFSSCLQSFPASGSFLSGGQLFTSGGQSIGALDSASVLPVNIQGWFPLGQTGLSPCCLRDTQESAPAPRLEGINYLALRLFYCQLSHPYLTTGKIIALAIGTFVGKVSFLLFNTPSRFVIAFLPRSKVF